jgi:hypothetical protein
MEDEKEDELLLGGRFLSITEAVMDFGSETTILRCKNKYSTKNICAEACEAVVEEDSYKLEVMKASKEKNKKAKVQ